MDPVDEDSISRIVTTWILTLEKQGCPKMIQAGKIILIYLLRAVPEIYTLEGGGWGWGLLLISVPI